MFSFHITFSSYLEGSSKVSWVETTETFMILELFLSLAYPLISHQLSSSIRSLVRIISISLPLGLFHFSDFCGNFEMMLRGSFFVGVSRFQSPISNRQISFGLRWFAPNRKLISLIAFWWLSSPSRCCSMIVAFSKKSSCFRSEILLRCVEIGAWHAFLFFQHSNVRSTKSRWNKKTF